MYDPPVAATARPPMMIDVDSVAMKGLMRPAVVIRPLTTPNPSPTSTPSVSASPASMCAADRAATTPAMEKIAPTERSKPPAMKTSVEPTAMMPTPAFWSRMLKRLSQVRNALLVIESVANSAMKAKTIP
jgi:hypothetical protein